MKIINKIIALVLICPSLGVCLDNDKPEHHGKHLLIGRPGTVYTFSLNDLANLASIQYNNLNSSIQGSCPSSLLNAPSSSLPISNAQSHISHTILESRLAPFLPSIPADGQAHPSSLTRKRTHPNKDHQEGINSDESYNFSSSNDMPRNELVRNETYPHTGDTSDSSQAKRKRLSRKNNLSPSSQQEEEKTPSNEKTHSSKEDLQTKLTKEQELKRQFKDKDTPMYKKALLVKKYIETHSELSYRKLATILECTPSRICEYLKIAELPIDLEKLNSWNKVSHRTLLEMVKFVKTDPRNLELLPTLFAYLNTQHKTIKPLNGAMQKFFKTPDISILKEEES